MIIWLLFFNCFGDNMPTNLVDQWDKNYNTEESCLKDAKIGSQESKNSRCYFACIKGFRKGK